MIESKVTFIHCKHSFRFDLTAVSGMEALRRLAEEEVFVRETRFVLKQIVILYHN